MIVNRRDGSIRHERIPAITDALSPGDRLVLNDTRVYPARLYGRKPSGGRVEMLVLALGDGPVPAIVRASKPLHAGQRIELPGGHEAIVCGPVVEGRCALDFGGVDVGRLLQEIGSVPLPPYIDRPDGPSPRDRERYQTIYARHDGSVAAPTAGLHFSSEILTALAAKRVDRSNVTLHVGPGTFSPVRGSPDEHRMEAETCSVSAGAVAEIAQTRARGGRIVAVGTTTVRALESAAAGGGLAPFRGPTTLFIRPGHEFRSVDALLTNFHLPGSTLLCLVMAFAGTDLMRDAYETAVAQRYRFYSFGDAMLIL
jgi:S-adenosylmethionine:tRNA ribosyltransferase-isomerase